MAYSKSSSSSENTDLNQHTPSNTSTNQYQVDNVEHDQEPGHPKDISRLQADCREKKGPIIQIVSSDQKSSVLKPCSSFNDNAHSYGPHSRPGYCPRTEYPCNTMVQHVRSNEMLVIKRQVAPPPKVTSTVVCQAVFVTVVVVLTLYLLYSYTVRFARAKEALATALLLLATLLVFKPKYFIPVCVWSTDKCSVPSPRRPDDCVGCRDIRTKMGQ